MKRNALAYPYIAIWLPIFIIVPMIFIAYYAFFDNGHFTLEFVRNLKDAMYWKVLLRSAWLALRATLICLLIGYPVAYMLSNMKKSVATMLSIFYILPMWMNALLRTYAWKVLLADGGIFSVILGWFGLGDVQLLYTEGAVLLGTVYNCLPFMIMPIYTTLMKLDKSYLEAARDLGANGIQTFFKVVLPLSKSGVISGITMVLVPAMSTFAISKLLGGANHALLGDLIEQKFLLSSTGYGMGSILSLILLVLVFISTAIMRFVEKNTGEEEGGTLW